MCIFIGCWPWSIKGHTRMASKPRQITSADFFLLLSCPPNPSINHLNFYCIKQLDTRLRLVLFCSLHAVTSSVIYYSTHKRKNVIYLLNTSLATLLTIVLILVVVLTWHRSHGSRKVLLHDAVGLFQSQWPVLLSEISSYRSGFKSILVMFLRREQSRGNWLEAKRLAWPGRCSLHGQVMPTENITSAFALSKTPQLQGFLLPSFPEVLQHCKGSAVFGYIFRYFWYIQH